MSTTVVTLIDIDLSVSIQPGKPLTGGGAGELILNIQSPGTFQD